ncbi:hypothetical protein QUA81_33830, partial [Microcoleus sp. F6_B4]
MNNSRFQQLFLISGIAGILILLNGRRIFGQNGNCFTRKNWFKAGTHKREKLKEDYSLLQS